MPENNDIIARLESGEAVALYDYMRFCLLDEERGYYRTAASLGQTGDFITAPDISQIFGEVIGFWLLDLWQRCNRPDNFTLIELGGGSGSLMRDILSLVKNSDIFPSLTVKIIDINPHFQKMQKHILHEFAEKISWHETLENCPSFDGSVAIIGNEFLDTLPIRQFEFDGGWKERHVIKDGNKLKMRLIETTEPPLPDSLPPPQAGDILEFAPDLPQVMEKINILAKDGGALLIDYGYENHCYGDSLQAVKKQKFADVLPAWEEWGGLKAGNMADLSAHVNFAAVAELSTMQPHLMSQREFLGSMGGALRLQKLLQKASPQQAEELTNSYKRISEDMGDLFKVLMLYGETSAHAN